MKEKWETPEVEVVAFCVEDVITASGMPDVGDQGTPWA